MSDAIISLDVLKSKEKHHYKGKGFIKNEIISFYEEKIILTYEIDNEKIDVIINSKKEEYL